MSTNDRRAAAKGTSSADAQNIRHSPAVNHPSLSNLPHNPPQLKNAAQKYPSIHTNAAAHFQHPTSASQYTSRHRIESTRDKNNIQSKEVSAVEIYFRGRRFGHQINLPIISSELSKYVPSNNAWILLKLLWSSLAPWRIRNDNSFWRIALTACHLSLFWPAALP